MVYRTTFSLILLTILSGIGLAQQRNQPSENEKQAENNPSWLPKNPFPKIDFSTLSYARMGADQKTIQIVKPGVTTETREMEVEKCTMTIETRQRTIQVDGKDVVQDYTVQVPVTSTEMVSYHASAPFGVQRSDIPLNNVRAWELSGKELSASELSKRLGKSTQVLVERISVKRLADFKFQPVEPFYGGVIKLDTIMIYCPPEEPKPSDKPQP